MKKSLLFFGLILCMFRALGQFDEYRAKEDTSIYILSCSPGYDLYSVFGHTAILVKTPTTDWVYNYGTFDFNTPGFYLKFAQGKLPYKLAKEQFGYFQYSYIRENRSITAQELNFSSKEKSHLIALLEENVQPENAEYSYDFFLDNCATRVVDIVDEASNNQINWNTHPNGNGKTFRQMIQVYLGNMEWSDLGIDIALGLPCDRKLKQGEQSFLPDSLSQMFAQAQLEDKKLIKLEFEVLPSEKMKVEKTFTDSTFRLIGLVSAILLVFIWFFKNSRIGKVLAHLILFINGLIGLLVFMLWFFTDHGATAQNLNLLWANPLNLILPLIPSLKNKWLKVFSLISLICLAMWAFLPQDLHESLLPFICLGIISSLVAGRILK